MLLLLVLACNRDTVALGDFELQVDPDTAQLTVTRQGVQVADLRELAFAAGTADISFSVGSYLFEDVQADWVAASTLKVIDRNEDVILRAELRDAAGETMGMLQAWSVGQDLLALQFSPWNGYTVQGAAPNRARVRLGCDEGGPFLGTGGHQLDVDHQGEAFGLWVAEPGIGKVETDDPPEDWFITGTKHATSYPLPFLLRPELPVGLLADTSARVDVDLCATDPGIYELSTWEGGLALYLFGGDDPLSIVERHALASGGVKVPPDVALGPWNDAIRGKERVEQVASTLRAAGAPTGILWTEDWKGAEQTGFGYHLSLDWTLDEELYPDAEGTAATLRDQGFEWLAYFSPFVGEDGDAWESAQDVLLKTEDGQTYTWPSATLSTSSALDLSSQAACDWAQERMTALLDVGFTGWMADFAEWLPPDAVMAYGDAVDDHNAYPLWWQQCNADLLDGLDATWFTRSGWIGTPSLSPVTWGGDQRTSFDADDGFPTVIPLGLGLSIAGVGFYGHDIAGYNSVGNDPSDQELWFRWAWLGAFSPIMRTHHGAFDDENHQFDTNQETLDHWVLTATEHARLFPYLKGLARLAQEQGRPALLHPALVYPGYDWARGDAWLLGSALFVAPVVEQGATGRGIVLPPGDWYDWWTGAPAQSGWHDAAVDEISVFAAAGTLVPMLEQAPETFVSGTALRDIDDVDGARLLRVFGTGGRFTEGDGTTYTVSGQASAAGEASDTLASGSIQVNGLTVQVEGTTERAYRVQVWP